MSPTDAIAGGAKSCSYQEEVARLAGLGSTRHRIARELRMAPATIESWLERGEADFEAEQQTEFSEFYLSFHAARARFVSTQLTRIDDAAKSGEWRAAVEFLRLIERDEFGPMQKHEHAGSVSVVQQHAEELADVFGALLAELDLTDTQMHRVPGLLEKHLAPLESAR